LLVPSGPRENEAVVVQCPTCSSKFRIADEKVTERGVRVRCTSCKNVFQVRKSGVVPAEAPSPEPEPGNARTLEAPGEGAATAPDDDDPFGMPELSDAPPTRLPSSQARASTPPPAAQAPLQPPLPPSVSGEHVQLGAFKTSLKDPSKTSLKDPFEGMDMGEPGTGAIELATQPKKDKAAKAEATERATEAASPATAEVRRAEAPPEEKAAAPAVVSSALTGLLGAALAIAVVVVSALSNDAALRWLGLGGASDIVATGIVSGIYDTAVGKQVFYVRGRVENRSKKVQGPVRVTAELVAEGSPESRAQTIAGAEPTAEDVWSLQSAADAEKLTRSLETSAVERKLQPGASLPFFAVIAEPPQDLRNRRLRVRVEAADAAVPSAAKSQDK
jgi:predicted Zn finger-like uncharacterized protein